MMLDIYFSIFIFIVLNHYFFISMINIFVLMNNHSIVILFLNFNFDEINLHIFYLIYLSNHDIIISIFIMQNIFMLIHGFVLHNSYN
jgi:hypothetical protein